MEKLIFIDESGDLGFSKSKGSSKYFVLCGIVTENNTAKTIRKIVRKIKKDLIKNDKKETD